jgi:ribonuclease PH
MTRAAGRGVDALRTIRLEANPSAYAEGSCLVAFGDTQVLCAASVEEGVPAWRKPGGPGWVTGEYAMLPRATHTRGARERTGPRGRTQEIQRLIGRALRSIVDLEALGPRTVIVDCDVLQADGGTRTASVTGGCVALAFACRRLASEGLIERSPLRGLVAAVSVGLIGQEVILDLDYREDVAARVDMNVVATADGNLVEVQGTAEGDPFPRTDFERMLDLAERGIRTLTSRQRALLDGLVP